MKRVFGKGYKYVSILIQTLIHKSLKFKKNMGNLTKWAETSGKNEWGDECRMSVTIAYLPIYLSFNWNLKFHWHNCIILLDAKFFYKF